MRTAGLVATAVVIAVVIVAVRSRTPDLNQARAVPAQEGAAASQTVRLTLPKMDCAGCEVGVRIAANKVNGVKDVKTDSESRSVEVTFDPLKTSADAIASAITKATGFETETAPTDKSKT